MDYSGVSVLNLSDVPKEDRQAELEKIIRRRTERVHGDLVHQAAMEKYTPEQMEAFKAAKLLDRYRFKDVHFYYVNKEPLIGFVMPRINVHDHAIIINNSVIPAEKMPSIQEVHRRYEINDELDAILTKVEALTGGTVIAPDDAREAVSLIEKAIELGGGNAPAELTFLLGMVKAAIPPADS
jgi:hypothetical protein